MGLVFEGILWVLFAVWHFLAFGVQLGVLVAIEGLRLHVEAMATEINVLPATQPPFAPTKAPQVVGKDTRVVRRLEN